MHNQILEKIRSFARTAVDADSLMQSTVKEIQNGLPDYNWVGFYMLDESSEESRRETLVLGPFVGAPTPHTRIPLNQGICGAAVTQQQTIVVDDVNSDPRYLACSLETKSEIVVPIRVQGRVVGELDIDSHRPAAFTNEDRQFCEEVCRIVGSFIEAHP